MSKKYMVIGGAIAAVIAVAGAAAATSTGSAPASTAGSHIQTVESPSVAGKELFRTIAFGQGRLADALRTTSAGVALYQPENNTPERILATDAVLDRIAAADAGYFADFASKLSSGDPFVVSAALDTMRPKLQDTALLGEAAGVIPVQAPSVDFNFEFNQNVHTNVNVFINETVGVNISVWITKPEQASGGLAYESLVADITKTFRQRA